MPVVAVVVVDIHIVRVEVQIVRVVRVVCVERTRPVVAVRTCVVERRVVAVARSGKEQTFSAAIWKDAMQNYPILIYLYSIIIGMSRVASLSFSQKLLKPQRQTAYELTSSNLLGCILINYLYQIKRARCALISARNIMQSMGDLLSTGKDIMMCITSEIEEGEIASDCRDVDFSFCCDVLRGCFSTHCAYSARMVSNTSFVTSEQNDT